MNRVNFTLGKVIDNTVDSKIKKKPSENLIQFYAKYKEDSQKVGRTTTYDVVGQRNYKEHFNEQKYKF
ncbi:ac55 [Sucra jujuba nucleopolyhedrovirus]|uniref:Ac55 n=1 Tax=Sucra jujuba nucleopolyhedrovirus TaxID=1563660 RepID=A0A097P8X3_9ABAC|nr:ac55 [Sucra jujuba nucleopolyhedrovirus]AIU41281.1 ac55 [Sucra jujuba nucleopolyhedrovirus]